MGRKLGLVACFDAGVARNYEVLLLAGSSYSHHRNSRPVNNRSQAHTGTSTPVTAYSWTRPTAHVTVAKVIRQGYKPTSHLFRHRGAKVESVQPTIMEVRRDRLSVLACFGGVVHCYLLGIPGCDFSRNDLYNTYNEKSVTHIIRSLIAL